METSNLIMGKKQNKYKKISSDDSLPKNRWPQATYLLRYSKAIIVVDCDALITLPRVNLTNILGLQIQNAQD